MSIRSLAVAGAVIVALGTMACAHEVSNMVGLHAALREQYPGARIEVGLLNGLDHLKLRFDSAAFHEMPDAPLEVKGREISRFALEHYGDAAKIDSVTIEFVRASSGGLLGSSSELTIMGYAASDLRSVSP